MRQGSHLCSPAWSRPCHPPGLLPCRTLSSRQPWKKCCHGGLEDRARSNAPEGRAHVGKDLHGLAPGATGQLLLVRAHTQLLLPTQVLTRWRTSCRSTQSLLADPGHSSVSNRREDHRPSISNLDFTAKPGTTSDHPGREKYSLFPFNRWENRGPERYSAYPQVL